MNRPSKLDQKRRMRLVNHLKERARLLRLPDDLIAKALVRCLPRGVGRAPTPTAVRPTGEPASAQQPVSALPSEQIQVKPLAELPVPTLLATAPTVVEDQEQAPPSAVTVVDHPVTTIPVEANPALNDALTPHSLAKLSEETSTWDALPVGAIIAGYRIEATLGAGAMGQVYKATQLSMNRVVAFKVLSPKLAANRTFRDRFVREARSAGRLHHPNLIAVHDVGEADGLMFFSMELVDGITVAELLRRHGRIPEMRALEICRQALEALKFAHSNGVVHRDIKPDNLMVTNSGMVKVADLGLARAEQANDPSATATNVGTVMGTPHYMAPEQGRDAHRVDHRTDLYAVGATLFHLVCGHTPFSGDSPMEVLMRAASQPLKFSEPGPSPAVRVLIQRLMEKEAADRPQSAAEAMDLISKLKRKQVDEDPESVPNAAEALARARRRRLRRTLRRLSWYALGLVIALGLVVIVIGMAGGWQWSSTRSEAERLARVERYREAVELLQRQQPGVTVPAAEISRVRSDIERAWDSWAYRQVQSVFSVVEEHLHNYRLAEAYTTLQSITDDQKSPRVRLEYDSYQRRWEQAMLAEEAKAAKPSDDRVRELWPQEYINHLGADLLQGIAFRPPTSAIVRENTVRLISTGNGRTDVTAAGSGRLLRFVVRFPDQNHGPDQLVFPLAEGRALVISRGGMTLSGTGGPRVLAKESDQYTFTVHFTPDGVDLTLLGTNRAVPIAKLTKELLMSWDVGKNRAIEVRLRLVPVDRRRR